MNNELEKVTYLLEEEVQEDKKEKGFTLIELLVVVAIIAILAAVAIPQFTKYKRNAAASSAAGQIATCMSELAAAYAEDSNKTTWDCKVGDSTIKLKLDPVTGNIDIDGENKAIVSGINVECDIEGNKVRCIPSSN